MPRGGDRIKTVHGQIPGTPLDRRVRVTGGTLTSLKKQLSRAKDALKRTVEAREADISILRGLIVEAEKAYNEALAEKREKEPGTFTVPGLIERRGAPPGVTPEEWVELRKSGKHLEYYGSTK